MPPLISFQVTALTLKKPVLIEIACNLAEEPVSLPIPFQVGGHARGERREGK